MLSETAVLSLLQASITGAGLVLAIYALIVPLTGKLFEYKAGFLRNSIKEFKQIASAVKAESTDELLDHLKKKAEEIKERKRFPEYLSWGVGITFSTYIINVFMCLGYLVGYNREGSDALPMMFGLSTFIFLVIGLYSIRDIYRLMQREFEETKAKLEAETYGKRAT